MSKLFCIIGKTGSGKDTLVRKACEEFEMKNLVSYATRPRRLGEGDTHIFISPDEVEKYRDDMAAYTKIGEIEYFSTFDQISNIDFYIIDPDGLIDLKKKIADRNLDVQIVSIFVSVPLSVRAQRVIDYRGDREIDFLKRATSEEESFLRAIEDDVFDYIIDNNKNAEMSYEEFSQIIRKEKE